MLTASSTPNQTRSMPSFSATGPISGMMMNASSKKSRKKASTNTRMLTTIRKPSWPPGRPVSRCSTHLGPSTPWNARLKTVAPIRMNSTKHDSFIVESIAWRISFRSMRPRASAITSAPTAPIAPPSVGVAMPRKMVPSTRKIRASGGIITKVTRSAMRDSKRSFATWLMTAATNATPTPTHIDVTINSSNGTVSGRDLAKPTAASTDSTTSTPSERRPGVPSSSRIVRASFGSAGTAPGRMKLTARMKSTYSAVNVNPGMKAPLYRSPTLLPSWSASTISTSEGGMICASVPDAAITPPATRRS